VSPVLLALPVGVLAQLCGVKGKGFKCLLYLCAGDTSPWSAERRGKKVVNKAKIVFTMVCAVVYRVKGRYLNSCENLQNIKSCQKENLVGVIDSIKSCIKRKTLNNNSNSGIFVLFRLLYTYVLYF
jgi:hypothetical protein